MTRPPALRPAVVGLLLSVLCACGGEGSEEPDPTSRDDQPLTDAADVVVGAVQTFRAEHDAYPRRIRQSGDRIELRRGALGYDAVANGVWDTVDLAWYADRPEDREVSIAGDPGRGNSFSFCVERGDRHVTVTGGVGDGVAHARSAGGCPGPPGR